MTKQTAKTNTRGDWKAMLWAVPIRNTAAEIVKDEAASVSVTVANRRPAYMIPPVTWFVPYKKRVTIELDGMGARLWHCCDGVATVENICDTFSKEYGLSFHEAKTAVTEYLGKLIQRGILAIILEGKQ